MALVRAYIERSTYSWRNIQSGYQKKSWFAWSGTSWNRWINDDVSLFFTPASKRWSGKSPKGPLRLILWNLLYIHTSIFFCVTCYQWRSVEQLFWKLWTKRRMHHLHMPIMRLICPPKFCLSISLGTVVIPRKNEEQRLYKIWEANMVAYGGGGGGDNCININTWRVCQTRVYHSQIFHWKQFAAWICQTLFLFLWGNLL